MYAGLRNVKFRSIALKPSQLLDRHGQVLQLVPTTDWDIRIAMGCSIITLTCYCILIAILSSIREKICAHMKGMRATSF